MPIDPESLTLTTTVTGLPSFANFKAPNSIDVTIPVSQTSGTSSFQATFSDGYYTVTQNFQFDYVNTPPVFTTIPNNPLDLAIVGTPKLISIPVPIDPENLQVTTILTSYPNTFATFNPSLINPTLSVNAPTNLAPGFYPFKA